MTVLLDSDILIEVAQGRNATIVSKWNDLTESEDPILYSPVSMAELWAGARRSEHQMLHRLFRAMACVPLDSDAGRQAGEYLRRYGKSHAVELGDALIAAGAFINGAALWTRNRKHYPMKELSFY